MRDSFIAVFFLFGFIFQAHAQIVSRPCDMIHGTPILHLNWSDRYNNCSVAKGVGAGNMSEFQRGENRYIRFFFTGQYLVYCEDKRQGIVPKAEFHVVQSDNKACWVDDKWVYSSGVSGACQSLGCWLKVE